ncbi:MAG TPA: 2-amino-3,7-dideoxy-D-threo-hept-6-ulosonate synthase [Thermoplasmata archaeon]|nr:2-amino-3,7-dideoxy-D-threo-hept-6-ulosonate synthase [Thermoplasmata archaeon]
MIGKRIRIERLMDKESRKFVLIPMDHGVSIGPVPGLVDFPHTVNEIARGGATAIVMHKGLVEGGHRGHGKDIGLVVHLSVSTGRATDPNAKVLAGSVEDCIRLGADGVSIHVNIGASNETQQLVDFGSVASDCYKWGMPLLAMMYPRGHDIKDPFEVETVRHVARIGAELGADIVKTLYTGSSDSFREVVKSVNVPVVIAGGPKSESEQGLLKTVRDAMDAGAAGVSIGRNIWQHKDVYSMTRAISAIVLENADVSKAAKILKG